MTPDELAQAVRRNSDNIDANAKSDLFNFPPCVRLIYCAIENILRLDSISLL